MTRAALGSVLIALALLTSSCGLCTDDVQRQQSSPRSALVATAFVRNCGATTPYVSIVSVHGQSDSFTDEKARVLVIEGHHSPELAWSHEGALLIRCPDCNPENVFRQVAILGGVKVLFDLKPGPQTPD
jgi:hypothetical protein